MDLTRHTRRGSRAKARMGIALGLALLFVPVTAVAASAASTPTMVDSLSSDIEYTGDWIQSRSSSDLGGSVQYSYTSSSVSFTFEGTGVGVLARTTSSSGISTVSIDGVKVGTIDGYSASTAYKKQVFTSARLDSGEHTIVVTRSGSKNAKSTGTNLIVDAFGYVTDDTSEVPPSEEAPIEEPPVEEPPVEEAPPAEEAPVETAPVVTPPVATGVPAGTYENTSSKIKYSGKWSTISSGQDSGRSSGYLNTSGSASLTFTGTAIQWVSRTTSSSGIAYVYIDDVKVATVDRYSKSAVYNKVVFEKMNLSAGTHTIKITRTGSKNKASSGANLLLDSFVVVDQVAPDKLTGLTTRFVAGTGNTVTWTGSSAADNDHYLVYSGDSASSLTLVGSTVAGNTSFSHVGITPNDTLYYAVTAVDTTGNESVRSTVSSVQTGATGLSYRYSGCPAATTTVTNASELMSAAANAAPGDVIVLAPGTYRGQVSIYANGTTAEPVWICGPRTAVIDNGSISTGHGIIVSNSSNVVLTGMTVTNALKGITVRLSDHVTISDTLIENIGYEGVHLREFTTHSTVIGNTIRKIGALDNFYGEGVYIGSSDANWCSLTSCQPDRSDYNAIVSNTISMTGSDLIEAKEGTSHGVIRNNSFNGTNAMPRAEAWVKMKGNDWSVIGNTGVKSSLNGFRIQGTSDTWGLRGVFSDNVAAVNASGYGFELYEPSGTGSTDTRLSCDNTVTSAKLGYSNVGCSK